MTIDMILDYLGIRFEGLPAQDFNFTMNVRFTDSGEYAYVLVGNGVVNYRTSVTGANPDVTIETPKIWFNLMTINKDTSDDRLKISGDQEKLDEFLTYLTDFAVNFPIMTLA